jgi:hypothetical protein
MRSQSIARDDGVREATLSLATNRVETNPGANLPAALRAAFSTPEAWSEGSRGERAKRATPGTRTPIEPQPRKGCEAQDARRLRVSRNARFLIGQQFSGRGCREATGEGSNLEEELPSSGLRPPSPGGRRLMRSSLSSNPIDRSALLPSKILSVSPGARKIHAR